ncbi:MAG: DsbA family protein [Pseudobacter sp.]|uniref:DsbA family protein n=1 Tax=Pseudobacter sp. TaxID=2045420 RepID=UPI003F7D1A76
MTTRIIKTSSNHMLAEEGEHEIEITYFTDPLCCWSYGMQPHLDSLYQRFKNRSTIKLVMGGLLPSWNNYVDQVNSVSRPAQMGPVWMHAARLTNRPIKYLIWVNDPPSSSYPACMAVKCAEMQSGDCSLLLFKNLQQAVMQNGKNIANTELILATAADLKKDYPSFNLNQFREDFLSDRGKVNFEEDLIAVTKYGIKRFPTLMIKTKGKTILIPGYRTLESLMETIHTAFGISEVRKNQTEQKYRSRGL